MSTNKSVSPAEFRLHNKVFHIDFAPSNYFERIRFEIIFQQLITWFWRQYGIYFYIQKLKMLDEKVLLQVYFYKTYLYQQGVKRSLQFNSTKSTEGAVENNKDNRYKTSFEWFYMYSPELFLLFNELKNGKKVKLKRRTKFMKKLVPVRPSMPTSNLLKKKLFKQRKGTTNLVSYNTTRPQH